MILPCAQSALMAQTHRVINCLVQHQRISNINCHTQKLLTCGGKPIIPTHAANYVSTRRKILEQIGCLGSHRMRHRWQLFP